MPIQYSFVCKRPSREAFYDMSHLVLGHAFATQNEYGRMLHEIPYKNILAGKLAKGGQMAKTEVPVTLSHKSFSKTYMLDLLVEDGIVYETKTVPTLNGSHHCQLLHYLYLTNLPYGMLVNFRSQRVEHRYVTASASCDDRKQYSLFLERNSSHSLMGRLNGLVSDLFADWGCFLALEAYRNALVHLFGGKDNIMQSRPVFWNGMPVGYHDFPMLDAETALHLSSGTLETHQIENQLKRLITQTDVRCFLWVNVDGKNIQTRLIS